MAAWMIRAGRGGIYAEQWHERGYVGIGWDCGGENLSAMNLEQIRAAYTVRHPDASKNSIAISVGQIYRFAHEMAEGSDVIMYEPSTRLYHLGKVAGPCLSSSCSDDITYLRKVEWQLSVPRDRLTSSSKNSLGSIMTIFSVSDEIMNEFHERQENSKSQMDFEYEVDSFDKKDTLEATYENGIELIKDQVCKLGWEDMERLVAGLLRAMGYCARITPRGSDGGRDVVASPDVLGLEAPRIVAEVKHRKGTIGAPMIRSFIAGLRSEDRGLYVSTGGFTKEARYEADRSNVPVRLLNLEDFVDRYVEFYNRADDETRGILPLTQIWWPA